MTAHHPKERRNGVPCAILLATVLVLALGDAPALQAAFHEQLAIDTKAISLANTVTADPPGMMAIHYNPAGLSNLPEGKTVSMGLTVPVIQKTSRFSRDPDFEGFFDADPAEDPAADNEGTNDSGRMYIPISNGTTDFLVSPALGISSRKAGSRWTFAFGQYAPFAVGLVHDDDDDPSVYGGKSVYQQHLIYAAPAVAYKAKHNLSLGLSVGIGQTAMGAELALRAPNDITALINKLGKVTEELHIPVVSELTLPPPWFGGGFNPYHKVADFELTLRDDFSPNYNVGLLYEPYTWLGIGLVYQSGVKAQLHGRYRFGYTEAWQSMVNWFGSSPLLVPISGMLDLPITPADQQTGVATMEVQFPQRVQMGLRLKPFSWLSLLGDLHWAQWSVVKEDRITFDQDIQLLKVVKLLGYSEGNRELVIRREFEDTLHWSVGMELAFTDWLFFRCGYERRDSSVQDRYYDLLYALPDLENYGAGFGIKLKNGVNIDLSGAYIVSKCYRVPNNSSLNLNSTDFTHPVYNPYAGLDYEQETITYMGSLKVEMPMEVMSDMLHHQAEMLKGIWHWLNPFDSLD